MLVLAAWAVLLGSSASTAVLSVQVGPGAAGVSVVFALLLLLLAPLLLVAAATRASSAAGCDAVAAADACAACDSLHCCQRSSSNDWSAYSGTAVMLR